MNKSSFVLTLIEKVSSNTLQVFDFFKTSTLIVRIKNLVKIIAVITISFALTITVKIKTVKLSISKLSLIYSNIVTVNIRNRITATTKAIGKMTVAVHNLIRITATTKAIGKMTVPFNLHSIKLALDMALGEFTELLVHDPELLEDVDPLTLEEMDFTIIP